MFHLTHEILLSPLNPPYKKELSSLLNFFTTFPNILIRDNIYKGAYVRTYLIRHELPPCDRLLLFQLASFLPTFFKNPSLISFFLELPPTSILKGMFIVLQCKTNAFLCSVPLSTPILYFALMKIHL